MKRPRAVVYVFAVYDDVLILQRMHDNRSEAERHARAVNGMVIVHQVDYCAPGSPWEMP